MNAKSIFASKTIWVNLLTLIVGLPAVLSGVVPEQYTPYFMAAVAIANVLLRLVTNQPVSLSPDKK